MGLKDRVGRGDSREDDDRDGQGAWGRSVPDAIRVDMEAVSQQVRRGERGEKRSGHRDLGCSFIL